MKRIAFFFPLNFIVFERTNHVVLDKNTKVANKGKLQRRKKQKSKCEDFPTSVEGSIWLYLRICVFSSYDREPFQSIEGLCAPASTCISRQSLSSARWGGDHQTPNLSEIFAEILIKSYYFPILLETCQMAWLIKYGKKKLFNIQLSKPLLTFTECCKLTSSAYFP